MPLRVAVDTGGTFTDFVVLDVETGRLDVFKLPSTKGDEAACILAGLRGHLDRLSAKPDAVEFFAHGTTVGTNAILEETGARTGLLVTAGFRGIYEVGEQARGAEAAIYDLFFEKPRPLVLPRLTEEVPERVSFQGDVLDPLDEQATRRAIRRLIKHDVRSIAVCLLFSFLRPENERAIRDLIREESPDVDVSLSTDVVPQIREYYRLSTTVVNAYLNPLLKSYIQRLDALLRGLGVVTDQRYVMRSNGGVATFEASAGRSVQTILSGPAAGVVAGQRLAQAGELSDVVTFDMGGTSTDVALIRGGEPVRRMGGKVHRRDVLVPMLDIHTVAAGGGTLAWVDDIGTLQVGPRSAGAVPGPACYGKGGVEPTVTDANLVLGRLAARHPLAGGAIRLDLEAAQAAIRRKVAEPLGLSLIQAARGIIEIVNVKMEEAIKVVSSNRGFDLRDFYLLAFGGAGPLHAGQMAQDLGMRGVVVPPFPGVTSALGLLLCDVRHDYVTSELVGLKDIDADHLNAQFSRLKERAEAELTAEGFTTGQMRFEYDIDLRYTGQGYELTIAVDEMPLTAAYLPALRDKFDSEHARLTGHSAPGEAVEIVNYRVTGLARVPQPRLTSPFEPAGHLAAALVGEQDVHFEERPQRIPLYDRSRLPSGSTIEGPAILLQLDATTVLPPGQTAEVDELGQLRIATGRLR